MILECVLCKLLASKRYDCQLIEAAISIFEQLDRRSYNVIQNLHLNHAHGQIYIVTIRYFCGHAQLSYAAYSNKDRLCK